MEACWPNEILAACVCVCVCLCVGHEIYWEMSDGAFVYDAFVWQIL